MVQELIFTFRPCIQRSSFNSKYICHLNTLVSFSHILKLKFSSFLIYCLMFRFSLYILLLLDIEYIKCHKIYILWTFISVNSRMLQNCRKIFSRCLLMSSFFFFFIHHKVSLNFKHFRYYCKSNNDFGVWIFIILTADDSLQKFYLLSDNLFLSWICYQVYTEQWEGENRHTEC